jgi:ribosomal protein L31
MSTRTTECGCFPLGKKNITCFVLIMLNCFVVSEQSCVSSDTSAVVVVLPKQHPYYFGKKKKTLTFEYNFFFKQYE